MPTINFGTARATVNFGTSHHHTDNLDNAEAIVARLREIRRHNRAGLHAEARVQARALGADLHRQYGHLTPVVVRAALNVIGSSEGWVV
jgi:hypothetical protein